MTRLRTALLARSATCVAPALALVLAMALALAGPAGCADSSPSPDALGGDTPGDAPPDAADVPGEVTVQVGRDHTLPSLPTLQDFLALAGQERAPAEVKFVLRDFVGPDTGVHFQEAGFYGMHDEWSWYSLLNGIAIPRYDFAPVTGLSFATVADVVDWADTQASLPLDLTWVNEGRLYSPRFYERAFNRRTPQGEIVRRFFGCGSVMHFDADARRALPGETWAFQVEYADTPTAEDVARFFEVLSGALPPDVAGRLLWVVRSQSQQVVAGQIDTAGGPYAHRWTTWDALQVPGDSQTYNPGIAAGRVRIVPAGETPSGDASRTIAVLREIPDDLPPVAAIVTAVPQTPLAHIGLLAKARGTPNVYVAGVADDPRFVTWDAYGTSILVKATEEGHVFREMTKAEWATYLSLLTPRQTDLPEIDVSTLPDTFDPLAATMAQMPGLVPAIGGKTAGFLALHEYPELDLPDRPLGLTVRGYAEFLATLDPPIAQVLANPDMEDARVQLAVCEGPDAYLAANGNSDAARAWLDILRQYHAGDAVGRVLAAGGIRNLVMTAPFDAG